MKIISGFSLYRMQGAGSDGHALVCPDIAALQAALIATIWLDTIQGTGYHV